MINTAKRLLPFARHKVIHINSVTDPILKRIVKDKRLTHHLRNGLKQIDGQYELLIPYRVDDEELQLKRYIQWKVGTKVNLTTLRKKYTNYYKKLYKYGSPVDVLKRWGLTPTHEHSLSEEGLLKALEGFREPDGTIAGVRSKNPQLYRSLLYQAAKEGVTVNEYMESKGFSYKG
ncbi:hypothetical protein [Brevibacillus laterosporus]|uniref:hypothetical protein n=1 Tax=Brevibacillus laterosporus TaxID=1465 RepID=UPI003D2035E6